jgi:hypothetical protein
MLLKLTLRQFSSRKVSRRPPPQLPIRLRCAAVKMDDPARDNAIIAATS